MLKYFFGLFKNLLNTGVSIFAVVDNKSNINKKAKINMQVKVYQSTINEYSYIGSKSELICTDIGKFCSIGHSCSIGLAHHSMDNISTSPIFTEVQNGTGYNWSTTNTHQAAQRVSIGNDVWIGIRVIIIGGVKIGNGVIIGAGTIVTKDIPDYAVAVGVPARIVRYRFEKTIIDRLNEIKWWNLPKEKLRNNLKLFQKKDLTLKDLERLG
jgi:acetyltransferase-like isoleucine patch superfamily enzyme